MWVWLYSFFFSESKSVYTEINVKLTKELSIEIIFLGSFEVGRSIFYEHWREFGFRFFLWADVIVQIGIKYFFMTENLEYQEFDFWAVSKLIRGTGKSWFSMNKDKVG